MVCYIYIFLVGSCVPLQATLGLSPRQVHNVAAKGSWSAAASPFSACKTLFTPCKWLICFPYLPWSDYGFLLKYKTFFFLHFFIVTPSSLPFSNSFALLFLLSFPVLSTVTVWQVVTLCLICFQAQSLLTGRWDRKKKYRIATVCVILAASWWYVCVCMWYIQMKVEMYIDK